MNKKDQEEMLNLLRRQEVRAQDRESQAKGLREAAGGAGLLAFFVLLAWMTTSTEGSDEISNPWMLYAIGVLLLIALILFIASYFRDT